MFNCIVLFRLILYIFFSFSAKWPYSCDLAKKKNRRLHKMYEHMQRQISEILSEYDRNSRFFFICSISETYEISQKKKEKFHSVWDKLFSPIPFFLQAFVLSTWIDKKRTQYESEKKKINPYKYHMRVRFLD